MQTMTQQRTFVGEDMVTVVHTPAIEGAQHAAAMCMCAIRFLLKVVKGT